MTQADQGGGGVSVPGDVALRDVVNRHDGNGLMVGLGDLNGLFQP